MGRGGDTARDNGQQSVGQPEREIVREKEQERERKRETLVVAMKLIIHNSSAEASL